MLRYALNRIIWFIPTLLAMAAVTFVIMRLTPGSPFDVSDKVSQEQIAQLERLYGLDKPLPSAFHRSSRLASARGSSIVRTCGRARSSRRAGNGGAASAMKACARAGAWSFSLDIFVIGKGTQATGLPGAPRRRRDPGGTAGRRRRRP